MPEKTGYEGTKVDEIRRILQEDHGITDEDTLKQTKGPLVKLLVSIEEDNSKMDELTKQEGEQESEEPLDGLLEEAEEQDDAAMQPYTEEESAASVPAYGTDNWHDYVMRQFSQDELKGEENAPSCDGCRRVAEQVLGPIIVTLIPSNDAPTKDNGGTATVVVHLELRVSNKTHPATGMTLIREDIADVNKANCDDPYFKHASATAATRAEGRILRKLLGLRNVITAEENSKAAEDSENDIDWTQDVPITDSQINLMDTVCQRLNVDVMSFVNSGRQFYDTIYSVKKSTANRMIRELNKLQRKTKDRPDDMPVYNPDWKSAQTEKGE